MWKHPKVGEESVGVKSRKNSNCSTKKLGKAERVHRRSGASAFCNTLHRPTPHSTHGVILPPQPHSNLTQSLPYQKRSRHSL